MKKVTSLVIVLLVAFAVAAQKYEVKASESNLKWTGKKVAGSHYGQIDLKEGSFTLKNDQIESGKFVIDMNSITCDDLTGDMNKSLVGHLKSDDFFSVETHPEATLLLSESTKLNNGKAIAKGLLTIKGITHPVEFEATQKGNKFSAVINVDRTLYNVRYGSGKFFSNLGDNMISDEFTLEVELQTSTK
ncbi:MAG: YceI family protein [Prolixibacteraceae bacterium]|nr:YceI family protein [Prolixibacteraceae bacterium]